MGKRIVCRNNNNNAECIFDYNFTPFFLVSVDGVYSMKNAIQSSTNTMTDGSTYQGSTVSERSIEINAQYDRDYQRNRDFLFKVFQPKSAGTLIYEEGEEKREISYRVESLDVGEKGVVRDIAIALLCDNPYFSSSVNTVVLMSGTVSNFEFLHEFQEKGEELGTIKNEKIKIINNESTADKIGMTIYIRAIGAVVNPKILNVQTQEYIEVDCEMQAGDIITITTETNNKNILLTRGKETININAYIEDDSEFLQLSSGINTLQYSSAVGTENMYVEIKYKKRYLGV